MRQYSRLKISFMIYISCYINNNYAIPQRRPTPLPFPHLTDFNISEIGGPAHIFEGVDYDELPKNLRDEYTKNCYAEHDKCIRFRTHFTPVCAMDIRDWYYKEYFSVCALDLDNCQAMVNAGRGMYGKSYFDRYIFFVGEGYKCEFYLRNLKLNNNSTKITNDTLKQTEIALDKGA